MVFFYSEASRGQINRPGKDRSPGGKTSLLMNDSAGHRPNLNPTMSPLSLNVIRGRARKREKIGALQSKSNKKYGGRDFN